MKPDKNGLILVGEYPLSYDKARLRLNVKLGNSGSVRMAPDGKTIDITVGADVQDKRDIWGTLIHEVWEYCAAVTNVRYRQAESFAKYDSDNLFFIQTHNQMSDCAARVGHFLFEITADGDLDRAIQAAKDHFKAQSHK